MTPDFNETIQARHEREYAAWRTMWADGLTLREMGHRLGKSTNAVSQQVGTLRKRYGWFPRRQPEPKPLDEAEYLPWREMWSNGYSISHIASKLGLPRGKVISKIYSLRQRVGWFPSRTPPASDTDR